MDWCIASESSNFNNVENYQPNSVICLISFLELQTINSQLVITSCQVHSSGFIEDQSSGALEVDFANKYLGGGALHRGCVQVYTSLWTVNVIVYGSYSNQSIYSFNPSFLLLFLAYFSLLSCYNCCYLLAIVLK